MEMIPNLHFSGECERAIELYEAAFGGRRTILLRHGEADPLDDDAQPGGEHPGGVYHAEMMIGGQRIMMNDQDGELPEGTRVSLLVSMDTVEAVKAAYETLKDGATILAPLGETSYSPCFVSLVDRYGIRWELMKESS